MTWLPPCIVALPLLVAGVLIAVMDRVDRRIAERASVATCVAVLAGCATLAYETSAHGANVVWFGGWHPGNVVGLGIAFAVDLAAATISVLVAFLTTAVVVFSREYFDEVGTIFYILLLAMLGSMIAFAFAADAFDLFVFYEVFSVAAYALSAYRIETEGAFEGALQFALTNTVAGLFILLGIILMEGTSGELNLAAIGHSLAAHGADPAVAAISFAFVAIGLLTRGALTPMHFWSDEVHANAPSPLSAILAGAMAPLALYGFARFYWTVYSAVLPPSLALAAPFLAIGVLSAVVGSVMCVRERNLKRALAFATVAHGGAALAALAAFSGAALASTAIYVAAYALGSAALFMSIAIVRRRTSTVDRDELMGGGHDMPLTRLVFIAGVVAIGGLPIAHAGPFAAILSVAVGAATGGTFLRIWFSTFVVRVDGPAKRPDVPWFMLGPAAVLALLPFALAFVPASTAVATSAAHGFVDRVAYEKMVLDGKLVAFATIGGEKAGWLPVLAIACVVGFAFVLARLQPNVFAKSREPRVVRFVVSLHDGNVGRYLGWIVATAVVTSACLSRL